MNLRTAAARSRSPKRSFNYRPRTLALFGCQIYECSNKIGVATSEDFYPVDHRLLAFIRRQDRALVRGARQRQCDDIAQNGFVSTRFGPVQQFGWCMHYDELSTRRSLSYPPAAGPFAKCRHVRLNAHDRIVTSGPPRVTKRPVVRCFSNSASADRPKRLDPAIARADIPVVQVDGRVAMAGDEPDFFAEPRRRQAWRHRDLAMLVRDRGAH
jgi:hypothetical protein